MQMQRPSGDAAMNPGLNSNASEPASVQSLVRELLSILMEKSLITEGVLTLSFDLFAVAILGAVEDVSRQGR